LKKKKSGVFSILANGNATAFWKRSLTGELRRKKWGWGKKPHRGF